MDKNEYGVEECRKCEKGLIIENIKLIRPCPTCFDGKRTWIDEIVPPSFKKLEEMTYKFTWDNIYTLQRVLQNECYKIGVYAKIDFNRMEMNHHIDTEIQMNLLNLKSLAFSSEIRKLTKCLT